MAAERSLLFSGAPRFEPPVHGEPDAQTAPSFGASSSTTRFGAPIAPPDVPLGPLDHYAPRQRRSSQFRSPAPVAFSAHLEAPHPPRLTEQTRPQFVIPDWSSTPYDPPQRARGPAFGGVLGYHAPAPEISWSDIMGAEGQGSRAQLLPAPAQQKPPKLRRGTNFAQRVIDALSGKWRPDMLLALSAAGRVCYGFGPIALEQQIDLSPETGSSSANSTQSLSNAIATATLNASVPILNGTGGGFGTSGNNGTLHHGFGQPEPVNFQGWTLALALLGIGLGVTGALGLFLDGLKFKRKLATIFFTLHILGIGLVTCGHIINDELSRALPVRFRIFAALPGGLGSGLHLMTIPFSYSASKYLRKGPTTRNAAATNMLLLAPLRAFGGTLIPLWGFSQIYPVDPYARDTLAIVANVSLIYAFAIPMVDLRAWIGGAPEQRSVSVEERRRRDYLGRAAMGFAEPRPRRRLRRLAEETPFDEMACAESYPLTTLTQSSAAPAALPDGHIFLRRPEFKRVHSI